MTSLLLTSIHLAEIGSILDSFQHSGKSVASCTVTLSSSFRHVFVTFSLFNCVPVVSSKNTMPSPSYVPSLMLLSSSSNFRDAELRDVCLFSTRLT